MFLSVKWSLKIMDISNTHERNTCIMGIPSLQETCFIKLAVIFCTNKGMEKHMIKQKNGIAQVEDGLKDLKESILILPLAVNVKTRLMHITERVGYEIFVFMTKSGLNYPEMQLNLAEDIQWYPNGLINEKETYVRYFGRNPNVILNFECLSIICAEKELRELWPKVCPIIERLKLNNLLVSYWAHYLQNNLNNFIGNYGLHIVGFEPDKSINYNMILYCLNFSFKTALAYFFIRLNLSEQRLLADDDPSLIQVSLFKKILKHPRQEHFKFICSFCEKPLMDVSLLELITKHMSVEGVVEFMDYLLRQVNFFGNLHFNLFKLIFAMLNVEGRSALLSKLDFYVLNLLAKGHFETFEFSVKNSKNILRQQIYSRLKEGKRLGLFYAICRNNQRHLLDKLILYLFEDDQETLFYLKSVLD